MHLQQELVDRYAQGPSQLRDSVDNLRAKVPNCLSTNADQPDKAEQWRCLFPDITDDT